MSNYKEFDIDIKNKTVNVLVEEKRVKNLRLKISPNCEVKMSVPIGVKKEEIEKFLTSKKRWIERNINVFESLQPYENKALITNGSATRILGREHDIWVYKSNHNLIEVNDLRLNIFLKNPSDKKQLTKEYEKFYKKKALEFFKERLDILYPIVRKHKLCKPSIKIRKMKTKWGTCNNAKQYITLNYHLFKAPKACIDYVILHELIHFLHPKHDKEFYNFLLIHMPDWKDRKRKLDCEMMKMIL